MKQAKVLADKELKRALSICEAMQDSKRNRIMLAPSQENLAC